MNNTNEAKPLQIIEIKDGQAMFSYASTMGEPNIDIVLINHDSKKLVKHTSGSKIKIIGDTPSWLDITDESSDFDKEVNEFVKKEKL